MATRIGQLASARCVRAGLLRICQAVGGCPSAGAERVCQLPSQGVPSEKRHRLPRRVGSGSRRSESGRNQRCLRCLCAATLRSCGLDAGYKQRDAKAVRSMPAKGGRAAHQRPLGEVARHATYSSRARKCFASIPHELRRRSCHLMCRSSLHVGHAHRLAHVPKPIIGPRRSPTNGGGVHTKGGATGCPGDRGRRRFDEWQRMRRVIRLN
mmetsp:Transcript_36755/g.106002  ORF Transcript_36755/g.106002 Transcript_36755/m.106002 type:complete len:210 (-) Transcript_36755:20-649(-)